MHSKRHTKLMGILNCTPDSFSDGGSFLAVDAALKRAEEMVREGADIIDVGGESTRPGSSFVSAEEEMERILPVIEGIRRNLEVPVSVDTYKAEVAKEALRAGAHIINDIHGLRFDHGEMAKTVAEGDALCVLMHFRASSGYTDLKKEVLQDLRESIHIAKAAGIKEENIILDPGIGFGKTPEENLELLGELSLLKQMGYPCLLGASRKSVIGFALDLPVGERLEGTLATTALAVLAGYEYVRVHDVKENARFIKMLETVLWTRSGSEA